VAVMLCEFGFVVFADSGAGTNLKVGGTRPTQSAGKIFVVALNFLL